MTDFCLVFHRCCILGLMGLGGTDGQSSSGSIISPSAIRLRVASSLYPPTTRKHCHSSLSTLCDAKMYKILS